MTCLCTIHTLEARKPNSSGMHRKDPSRTTVLRNQFAAEMRRRFQAVILELTSVLHRAGVTGVAIPGEELYSTSTKRIEAFISWLRDMVDRHVLRVYQGPAMPGINKHWTDMYIQSAYRKGVTHAQMFLRDDDALTDDRPVQFTADLGANGVHADRVALLFTRTYNELVGVTDAMKQQMVRTLVEGVVTGLGFREIARNLSTDVTRIGKARGELIARTEVIRAYNEAALNEYEAAGLEEVEVLAEWLTAGDDRVCPRCAPMQGKVYTLAEAHGVLPLHPQCRCVWTPRVVAFHESSNEGPL